METNGSLIADQRRKIIWVNTFIVFSQAKTVLSHFSQIIFHFGHKTTKRNFINSKTLLLGLSKEIGCHFCLNFVLEFRKEICEILLKYILHCPYNV